LVERSSRSLWLASSPGALAEFTAGSKAVAYAFHIAKAQAFNDGNRRGTDFS